MSATGESSPIDLAVEQIVHELTAAVCDGRDVLLPRPSPVTRGSERLPTKSKLQTQVNDLLAPGAEEPTNLDETDVLDRIAKVFQITKLIVLFHYYAVLCHILAIF